jgi:hypothetical protein
MHDTEVSSVMSTRLILSKNICQTCAVENRSVNTLRTGDEDSRHLRFCVINVKDG